MSLIKLLAVAAMSTVLWSCNESGSRVGADGYMFGTRQFEKKIVTVEVVVHKDLDALQEEARRIGVVRKLNDQSASVQAFTHLYPPNFDTCTIHMVDPSSHYAPEFVGHEFLHCVYGQWHTDNNSQQ